MNSFHHKNSQEFANIIEYISSIDIIYNKAYIAKKYNYCKPTIKNSDKSFFDAVFVIVLLNKYKQQKKDMLPMMYRLKKIKMVYCFTGQMQ